MRDNLSFKNQIVNESLLSFDYQRLNGPLGQLYRKSVAEQWSVVRDIDWDAPLDHANPLALREPLAEIGDTRFWSKFSASDQLEIGRELQRWKISQILHTEQAAMLVCSALAQTHENLDAKLCCIMQATDEARHVEAYQKLLVEKMGGVLPINKSLETLLIYMLSERRQDILSVGMQIIVEGVGLALFRRILAYSESPLVRQLLRYIIKDEARHFALGKFLLGRDPKTNGPEIEDFICDALILVNRYLESSDVLVDRGMARADADRLLRASRASVFTRHTLYRTVVPAIFELNLGHGRVLALMEEMNISQLVK